MTGRDRIAGISFVRMALAVGIIIFHFSCHTQGTIRPLYMVNGYAFGEIITTCFIVLSGAMMYYNHEMVTDVLPFWIKRFRSIYPAFWIAYFIEYINNAVGAGTLLWSGARKWTVIVSVMGLDGWLMTGGYGTFYILGEWFLGVIVLLYALYPALSWCARKSFALTGAAVYAAYGAWMLAGRPFWTGMTQNIAFFYTGMLLIRHRDRIFKGVMPAAVSAVVCILISVIPAPAYKLLYLAYAVGTLIILQRIGALAERTAVTKRISDFAGGISYEMFLVQHLTILRLLRISDPTDACGVVATLAGIILVTVIYAWLLHLAAAGAVKSCTPYIERLTAGLQSLHTKIRI